MTSILALLLASIVSWGSVEALLYAAGGSTPLRTAVYVVACSTGAIVPWLLIDATLPTRDHD